MLAKTIHSCDDGKKHACLCSRRSDYRGQMRLTLPKIEPSLPMPLFCMLMPVTGGPGGFRGLPVSSVACSTPPV